MAIVRALLRLVVVFGIAALATACSDFAAPAEFDRAQIIGVRAEPPAMVPGERSRLELLAAGPDGPLAVDVAWSAAGAGRIERDDDGGVFVVGDASGPIVVEARMVADGRELTAVKQVMCEEGAAAANPTVTAVRVDGAEAGTKVELAAGSVAALDLEVSGEAGEGALVSWYATASAGVIDRYRIEDPELVAAEEAGLGWLFVVYRDGEGGTAWRQIEIFDR